MAAAHITPGKLTGYTIIIPLNIPFGYTTDYISQTARILKNRNRVILFDFRYPLPLSTFAQKEKVRKKFWRGCRTVQKQQNPGITLFRPLALFPFQRFPFVAKINFYLGIFQLALLLRLWHRPLGLWGFHPYLAFLLNKFGEVFSIYDCTDYYGEEREVGEILKQLEKEVFHKASHVFFNSQALLKKKLKDNPILKSKASTVVCGCDVNLFQVRQKKKDILAPIPPPRLGLVGHINYRIGFPLVLSLLKNHPDWSVVFIGPAQMAQPEDSQAHLAQKLQKLKAFPNFYYLGNQPKTKIPTLVNLLDIGIIPYHTKYAAVRFCNPMKAYEYLGCGKPVVATEIPALKELNSPLVATTKTRAD
ncbi:MAG: glycosyltransferase, partial [Patescibacteria group bacterium]